MDRLSRTAAELEEEMRLRLGVGDYKVTIHQSPELGWRATVYGDPPVDVDRMQTQADTVAAELCQHFELKQN